MSTQRKIKRSKQDHTEKIPLEEILNIGTMQSKVETPKSGDYNISDDNKKPAKENTQKRAKKTHTSLQSIIDETTQKSYEENIITALKEHGYQILLDWLTIENYRYSIYQFFLEQENWNFILQYEEYRQIKNHI